jgi:hypothetical protein
MIVAMHAAVQHAGVQHVRRAWPSPFPHPGGEQKGHVGRAAGDFPGAP